LDPKDLKQTDATKSISKFYDPKLQAATSEWIRHMFDITISSKNYC